MTVPGGPPQLTLAEEYAAVSADLTADDWPAALAAAGYDMKLPTVWIAEGLLYYLPEEAVLRLLRAAAAASAPGSSLLASCVNASAMRRAQRGASEAMRSFCSAVDVPADFFGALGWPVLCCARVGDAACNYGRLPAPPADEATDSPRTYYVVCERGMN